jgi:hypothetical protein
MNIKKLLMPVAIAIVAATTACAAPRGRVYVRVGPPAPIVERRIVAPGPGYVWVPGYHVWNGGGYAWRPGRWVVPPRPRAVWVVPHWQHDRRGWFFIEGHWH